MTPYSSFVYNERMLEAIELDLLQARRIREELAQELATANALCDELQRAIDSYRKIKTLLSTSSIALGEHGNSRNDSTNEESLKLEIPDRNRKKWYKPEDETWRSLIDKVIVGLGRPIRYLDFANYYEMDMDSTHEYRKSVLRRLSEYRDDGYLIEFLIGSDLVRFYGNKAHLENGELNERIKSELTKIVELDKENG